MVCEVVCAPSLSVSYREVRFDYAIEACPSGDALAASTGASDGAGMLVDRFGSQLPPEILTDYVDLTSLVVANHSPIVHGAVSTTTDNTGGGSPWSTSGPIGPIGG